MIGDGFIKLNPKQMKNAKAEMKQLLGDYTIETSLMNSGSFSTFSVIASQQ